MVVYSRNKWLSKKENDHKTLVGHHPYLRNGRKNQESVPSVSTIDLFGNEFRLTSYFHSLYIFFYVFYMLTYLFHQLLYLFICVLIFLLTYTSSITWSGTIARHRAPLRAKRNFSHLAEDEVTTTFSVLLAFLPQVKLRK